MKILDTSVDTEVAELIIEQLEDCSFSPEESIPGLIKAITILAEHTHDPEQALDEAANILADTGVIP